MNCCGINKVLLVVVATQTHIKTYFLIVICFKSNLCVSQKERREGLITACFAGGFFSLLTGALLNPWCIVTVDSTWFIPFEVSLLLFFT